MKRVLGVLLASILMFSLLALAGCGGEKKDAGQPAGAKPAAQAPQDDVLGLLAKGKEIKGLSYDFTMTSKDYSMSGKMWLEKDKVKTEMTAEGQKMITIFDGASIISYNPAENMAFKITPEKSQVQKVESPLDYSEEVEGKPDKVKVVEHVVYDGVKCTVVEVVTADGKEQSKMWVREDYGIPVRVEATDAGGGKMVMEYKNLQVGQLPADTFQLPAGVQVKDMSEMMKNMPNMGNMPGGQQ